MKKILIGLIVFIAISLSFEAQGQFNAARYKYDYFGGIKIGKTVEIGTTLTYTNKAGSFLGHIDSLVVDNVTTPTLFKLYSGLTELRTSPQTADYVIDKVGSTYYARPGIGTGYTAYSGATASTVINAAITAMTTGGDIYFKRGSYTITASIVDAGYSNVNLIFEKGAKLIAGNALNAPVIDLTTVSHWRIKGVEIDGNSANQAIPTANDGIKMNTVNDIIVSDAYIHDVREFGFYITGVSSYSGIINSTLTTCGWNGVQLGWINNGTYLFCKDCDISHCGDNGASLGGFAPVSYTHLTLPTKRIV